MSKKLFSLLLLTVFLYAACKKNDTPGGPDTNIPDVPKEGILIQTSVFGRVVDEKDEPMIGVTITGGGTTTMTDANGIFILKDVMLDQARAYITATKIGFFNSSRTFRPMKGGMSRPPLIKLLAQKSIGTINAAAGGAAASKGGTKIELPANAIEGYSGAVNVVANYVNPTSPDFFARMPGDLAADNKDNKRGALISYGMSHIDLLDDKGNKVKIKPGMEATVTLPVPKSLQANATATIDMWYFDETKGIWKQEGKGVYQNGVYVGKVSHFSVWNYDHWTPLGSLPFILRWMLSKISSVPPEGQEEVMNNPPDFMLTIKDKKTKTTLYSDVFPTPVPKPNSNPRESTSEVTFQIPTVTDVMEVTVTPVQPGGPDYPTNKDYSPTEDETPPTAPKFAKEEESVTVDVIPANPNKTITITLPPQSNGGGGNGETIVNVNGKAVNCNNTAVKTGYAFLSMRSGNTIVKSTTSPIYGNEGRFSAQYVFYTALPNRIDNVVLTVYDLTTGKKSKDLAINVNPSVAHMLKDPVVICDNNNGGGSNPNAKVFNGNYYINNASTLKAFIDSGYNEVNGILYVNNQSDFSGIISLKKVWGLELRNNSATNLGGFAELESISWLSLVANGSLVNAAFPKLGNKEMQGIHINHNLSLVGLTIPSIENVSPLGNDNISITGNPVLKTLSIPNLKSVEKCGNIEITNTLLENLNVFANAKGTLGSWGLTLVDHPMLTSVAGMKNIVATGRLTIDQCPKLATLEGINIPADVTDWVMIHRTDVLTDITAVSNKLKSTAGLSLNANKALVTASFPLFEKGDVSVKEHPVLATLSLPKFKEANAVDVTNNPKIATINMNALETLTNSLILNGGYEKVQALSAFDLPALKTCGRFLIMNCPGITNLDGFANLETVTGDFTISNANIPGANVKLQTINGFNKLTAAKYSLSLENAASSGDGLVGYDGPLHSIKGFKNLKTVGATFNIGGKNLTDVSGFANLESIGQDFRIITTGLTGVEGFAKLSSSGLLENRAIYISFNTKLTSLKGFASLADAVAIYITRNPELKDLQGMEKIKSLRYGITLVANEKLVNIDGLANVDGAITSINISENTVLSSLCGITKVMKGSGPSAGFTVRGNAFNPTADEIKAGTCSR